MSAVRRTAADLGKLATTLGLGALTLLTPRGARASLAARLGTVGERLRSTQLDEMARHLGGQFPDMTLAGRRGIAADMRAVRIEQAMCRGYGIFRSGWPAEIVATGADHVRDAHEEGRGVVLWMMTFLDFAPLNLVASEAGYPVTHLSMTNHGVQGDGPISLRIVAPIVLRGEIRSQRRRVIISPGGGLGYLRELVATIEEEHGTVSIRGDLAYGRRLINAPFMGSVASFPTGAPSLAHRSGAPLLTAAIVRRGPLVHEVIFEEPIRVSRDLGRHRFQSEAVKEFAGRLENMTRRHPGSQAWLTVMNPGGRAHRTGS